jgi:hypothetical protein
LISSIFVVVVTASGASVVTAGGAAAVSSVVVCFVKPHIMDGGWSTTISRYTLFAWLLCLSSDRLDRMNPFLHSVTSHITSYLQIYTTSRRYVSHAGISVEIPDYGMDGVVDRHQTKTTALVS